MTTTDTDRESWLRQDRGKADNMIGVMWIVGLLLLVVGVILAASYAPGTGTTATGDVEESGEGVTFVLGLLVAGVGQLFLLVGVVAQGVALGMRSVPGLRR